MAGTTPGHDGKSRPRRKPFTTRIKSRPVRGYFTLCLPGSPKVNAGGACGAWLPGRELLRISASTTASRDPHLLFEVKTQPGITKGHVCRGSRSVCGLKHLTSFAQWMVQDASIGRCDRWGPKLTC